MKTNPKPPADLTPAELIAELERRATYRADCGGAHAEAYTIALALVRPVVERLERERDDARTAVSVVLERAREWAGAEVTLGDLTVGQRGDPDA